MEILEDGIIKSHVDACNLSALDSSVQEAGMKFDEVLAKIGALLGKENNNLVLELEAAMNNYAFLDTFAVYKIGLSDGMQLQQEINALGGRK